MAALEASFVCAHKATATITTENAFVAVRPVDGFSTRITITGFAAATGMTTTARWWSTCG
ncbi:hypothetical protein [Occallatibacter riparius]|uniref:Uncharacterized protein n=1 Tax=Occallatibacter riparius TaxID=1002689 RepID=A0A9J7BLU6_9BACT|nr:hypothetical protein [Occallatibacter riparius]UWZ83615.1 hypothetical protein MOP44_23990 [Occallatibacter riparius]